MSLEPSVGTEPSVVVALQDVARALNRFTDSVQVPLMVIAKALSTNMSTLDATEEVGTVHRNHYPI